MPSFLLRGFRRPRAVIESVLGSLERQVLETLWAIGGERSVRELQAHLDGALAYTTLMTTMDRLYKKRLLGRRRQGRAFLYQPLVSADELRKDVAADLIGSLLDHGPGAARPLLSTFVDAVEERDAALLDELEALVRARRRGRPRGPR
jgi:predicted transcriptional regulator